MTVDVPLDVVLRLTVRWIGFFDLAFVGKHGALLDGAASDSDGSTEGGFLAGEGVYRTGAPGTRSGLALGATLASDTTRRNCLESCGGKGSFGEGGCAGCMII